MTETLLIGSLILLAAVAVVLAILFLRRTRQRTPAPKLERIFNNDLLMNDASARGKTDLEKAKEQFPEIAHVLDCPALREKFAAYEKKANQAREHVRTFGFAAV